MPNDFPPWSAVYMQFVRWKEKGVFIKMHDHLRAGLREALGKNAWTSVGIADSQSVKTVEEKGSLGFDANKRIKGRKRHILVDHLGLMIAAAVGATNCTDRDGLDALCGLNKARIKLLKKKYADLGYSGEDMRNRMLRYGIDIETIGRRCKKTFEVEPKRWIVERTFA